MVFSPLSSAQLRSSSSQAAHRRRPSRGHCWLTLWARALLRGFGLSQPQQLRNSLPVDPPDCNRSPNHRNNRLKSGDKPQCTRANRAERQDGAGFSKRQELAKMGRKSHNQRAGDDNLPQFRGFSLVSALPADLPPCPHPACALPAPWPAPGRNQVLCENSLKFQSYFYPTDSEKQHIFLPF